MQNKGKLTIMKYFRACVGSFLVIIKNVRNEYTFHFPRIKVDKLFDCPFFNFFRLLFSVVSISAELDDD